MKKSVMALLACAAIAIPAAAQIGAPGATDWVKKPQPRAASPMRLRKALSSISLVMWPAKAAASSAGAR